MWAGKIAQGKSLSCPQSKSARLKNEAAATGPSKSENEKPHGSTGKSACATQRPSYRTLERTSWLTHIFLDELLTAWGAAGPGNSGTDRTSDFGSTCSISLCHRVSGSVVKMESGPSRRLYQAPAATSPSNCSGAHWARPTKMRKVETCCGFSASATMASGSNET